MPMSKRPLAVLHIIDTLGLGGAQTLLRGVLAAETPGARHYVFGLRRRGGELELPADRCWVHESGSKWSLAPLGRIRELIDRIAADIVHCHLPRSELFAALSRARARRLVRLIAHEHGQILGSDDGRRTTHWSYCAFKRTFAGRFDRHVAVSEAVRRKLVAVAGIPPERAVTLHNFIDAARFGGGHDPRSRESRRRLLGIAPEARVVGFAGRLIRRKGWEELLRAIQLLKSRGNDLHLLMAGDGPERELMLARVRSLGIADRVHYIGLEKDMPGFYGAVDCVAMPSRFEALGQVQLEAMAMGVPLVLADAPGANEVARPGVDALYVRINDPAGLADALTRLLEDASLAARLCASAQERVADFSSGRYVAALENLYRGALHD